MQLAESYRQGTCSTIQKQFYLTLGHKIILTMLYGQDVAIEPARLALTERLVNGALLRGVVRAIGAGMMHQVVHVAAEHLFRPVPEHLGAGAVDKHASSLQIDAVDSLSGRSQ